LTADPALARSNGFGAFGGLGLRIEISDSSPILHCGGNLTDFRFSILDFRLTILHWRDRMDLGLLEDLV
jgi:hypothetical protein